MKNFLTKNFSANLNAALFRGIKTLVAIKSDALKEMAEKNKNLHYLPNLVADGEDALRTAIKDYRPDTLIVGPNKVSEKTLEIWNSTVSDKSKLLIRRGTSTATIDVNKAKELGIAVENTAHVNSVEIAHGVFDILQNSRKKINKIGLIGFGHIGREIAKNALAIGKEVTAFSPKLSSSHQENKSEFHGIALNKITVAPSAEEVIKNSDAVAISASLGQYQQEDIIDSKTVDSLKKDALLICISEPEVFSKDALKNLVQASDEKNLEVVFDNSAYAMKELKKEVVELGGKEKNFTFQAKLMSYGECQRDMDIAVLALLFKNSLCKKLPEIYQELKNFEPEIDEKNRQVKIVGAGISSLITAFYFHEKGFAVEVLEKDSKEDAQGITRRGPNARHLSFSETVTHASSKRIADWLFDNVTKEGNFFEKLFAEQFKTIGSNEALVSLLQHTMGEINRNAIEGEFGWNYLHDKYPDIFNDKIFGSGKLLRIFPSEEDLQKILKFQKEIHAEKNEVRVLSKEESREKLSMLNIDGYAGVIETKGYGVRVKSLCDSIENHLQKSGNSKITWQREVIKKDGEFVVKNQQEEVNLEDVSLVISSGISPIIEEDKSIQRVYGIFVSIPNCGVTEPIKIHEKDPLGVVNITPEDGQLHISAGFQYFGSRDANESDLKNLFEKLETKIAEVFPESYKKAVDDKTIERKFCPRPMTSHGLPQFVKSDKAVSIGGTNSGGTVEATILGQLALLQVQNDLGVFDSSETIKEAVSSTLETAQQCLNYVGKAAPNQSPKNLKSSERLQENVATQIR